MSYTTRSQLEEMTNWRNQQIVSVAADPELREIAGVEWLKEHGAPLTKTERRAMRKAKKRGNQ